MSGALGSMAGIPGVDINFLLVFHGEQDLEIKKTIPTQARVVHKILVEAKTKETDTPVITNAAITIRN